ncbi:MAG TPA: hypothetical protein VK858_21585 [Longimicrobiales bacterium]|nr:hypothetical protein [Longimicrobiales bacterium]
MPSTSPRSPVRIAGLALLVAVGVGSAARASQAPLGQPAAAPSQEANADFDTMMDVLTHPRCVNCHPAGDTPRIGDGTVEHHFGVRRGADNRGLPALRCSSCHQPENNDLAGVPGAPEWSLAPRGMAWEGKSRSEIARSILDPADNGGRTLEEVVDHLTHHELVLWAWEPGVRADGTPREAPPVDVETYIAAVRAWAAAGAPIPEDEGAGP